MGGTTPILEKDVPVVSDCGTELCWERSTKGFKYFDRKRARTSTSKVDMRIGDEGRAKIRFSSKGGAVGPPALPMNTPVTAQLVNVSNGECWSARYPTPLKETSTRFKAKSD